MSKLEFEKNGFTILKTSLFKNNLFKDISKKIEEDIEKDFNHALIGIKKLPSVARSGVYLSYNYYRELLNKIKLLDAEKLKEERIRVSNFKKFIIFLSSYINPL